MKRMRFKLYGMTGFKSGARPVLGGRTFENREIYIDQSKRTTRGVVPQIEIDSRIVKQTEGSPA